MLNFTINNMLNIKEEVEICLLKRGLSMRTVAAILKDKGYDIPIASGLSNQFRTKRVRFETVQEILDYLGFELILKEKQR